MSSTLTPTNNSLFVSMGKRRVNVHSILSACELTAFRSRKYQQLKLLPPSHIGKFKGEFNFMKSQKLIPYFMETSTARQFEGWIVKLLERTGRPVYIQFVRHC